MERKIKMKGSPFLQSTCIGRRRHILLPPLAARRPPRALSPQGFGGGQAFPSMHGVGIGAWKASHPDFRTPFSSVEDAITRCVDLDPLSPSLPSSSRRGSCV
jgi:hypothetical protein